MRRIRGTVAFLVALACGGPTSADEPAPAPSATADTPAAALTVTSPAFEAGATIPGKHTCEGEDVSPALVWGDPPEGTKSFALLCDDPDAPVGNWSHWVLWNVEPTARGLEEGSTAGVSGQSDFRRPGYGGPCPPEGHGPHRYFFEVYALDSTLDLPESTKKKQLEKAMEGHVLAKGELMGRYERR